MEKFKRITIAEQAKHFNRKASFHLAILTTCFLLAGCANTSSSGPFLVFAHTENGDVQQGSVESLVNAVRSGCEIRVAWGARRKADPRRTIEHSSKPVWVAVRDGNKVEVQLDDFLINLRVLGEPENEHPQRERFGGTSEVVMWRANLLTDGTFNAVWFKPHSGEFVFRAPQRHPMKWFSNCPSTAANPLFPG